MMEANWFEDHIPASIVERVPEKSVLEMFVGLLMLGTGAGFGVFGIVRRKRGFLAWAIPGMFLAGGLALLADRGIDRRSEHIAVVRDRIRDELSELDPVARVQVMRDALQEQFAFLKRG